MHAAGRPPRSVAGRRRSAASTGETSAAAAAQLAEIGLHAGEQVRFRNAPSARWSNGRISNVSADGSITLHDVDRGAAHSLRPDRLEVRRPGIRGRLVWQNVAVVAITWEQLELF